ncbi:cupin domain-containing protein [Tepidibacillus sp. LV47]|uniref:cupin domain-containing protein n=1 Tax=Tepidibacillus sp. LV47 TaxID=3398228 RepID=UPI003AAF5E48
MKVVSIKELKDQNLKDINMKILFDETMVEGSKVTFGIVQIPPGARIPENGYGVHDGDEYALILKGSILVESGGNEFRVSGGHATFIPANEEHLSYNDGDQPCEIVWALVKR